MTSAGDRGSESPRSIAALAGMALLALALFVGLLALGTWQVHRRAWKLDLIAQVDRRIHAAPVPAPGPQAWASITAQHDAYRRIRIHGTYRNDRATLVQATTALGGGYWVMTPLQSDRGFTVLINRGFVSTEKAGATAPVADPVTVTGLLRITEPKGGFLRANDPAANRWYSRDVTAIAQAGHIAPVAPYFIDADRTTQNPDGPVSGMTVIAFSNNHLVYALTWYALAMMVAGAAGMIAREEWRIRRKRDRVAP